MLTSPLLIPNFEAQAERVNPKARAESMNRESVKSELELHHDKREFRIDIVNSQPDSNDSPELRAPDFKSQIPNCEPKAWTPIW